MARADARARWDPQGPGRRHGPQRRWSGAAAAAVALLLSGCSGTRFGDQLARSFSSPGAPAPPAPAPAPPEGAGAVASSPAAPAAGAAPGSAAGARPGTGPGPSPAPGAPPAGAAPGAKAAAGKAPAAGPRPEAASAAGPSTSARVQPLSPAPYRVTIKLPGADPSAPAEVVTRALRAAGVSFEVETIERIVPAGLAPAPAPAPVASPAPAPR